MRRRSKRLRTHSVVLAGVLAVLPTAAAHALPAEPACTALDDASDAYVLGPVDAPIVVDLFLDPTHSEALSAWLEARRLAAEYRGALAFRILLIEGLRKPTLTSRRVAAWAVAAQELGRLESALRLLSRETVPRVFARLQSKDQRATVATDLGTDPDVLGRTLSSGCAERRLHAATKRAGELYGRTGSGGLQTPLLVLEDGTVFDDSGTLTRLRPELAARTKRAAPLTHLPTPELKGVSAEMRRPSTVDGVVLGGRGLPHRLLVTASKEDDSTLSSYLPFVLRYRGQNPGRVSVHVVARGSTADTSLLRGRLCAARRLGLELGYLRFLAKDQAVRRSPNPVDTDLLDRLDKAAAHKACTGEPPSPSAAADPLLDGPWLDGTTRTRPEVQQLKNTVRLLETSQRPLSPILSRPRVSDT